MYLSISTKGPALRLMIMNKFKLIIDRSPINGVKRISVRFRPRAGALQINFTITRYMPAKSNRYVS